MRSPICQCLVMTIEGPDRLVLQAPGGQSEPSAGAGFRRRSFLGCEDCGGLTGDQGCPQEGPGLAEVVSACEEPPRLEPRLYSTGGWTQGKLEVDDQLSLIV